MAFNSYGTIAPLSGLGFGGGMSPFGAFGGLGAFGGPGSFGMGPMGLGGSPFGGESSLLSPEAGDMNPYMNCGGQGQSSQSPMEEMAEMALILGLLLGLMSQLGGANGGGFGSPFSPFSGGGGYPGSIPGIGGGYPGFGGSGGYSGVGSPGGGSGSGSSSPTAPIQATGSGAKAVQLAESQLGKQAIDVNLPGYTHAGGVTNDCADFVSSCVADAGLFKKNAGDANVQQFQKDLVSQGWQPVSKSQAQPGDVAIILGGGVQHTELVAAAGATNNIGSNGTSTESVSTDNLNWATGVTYYAPPPKS